MSSSSLQDEELWLRLPSCIGTLGLSLARLEVKIWLDLLPSARRESVSTARKLADSLSGLELWIEFIDLLDPELLALVDEDVDCLVLKLLARVGMLLNSTPQSALTGSTRAAPYVKEELKDLLEKIDYLVYQTDDEASDSERSDSGTDENASTAYTNLGTLSKSLSTAVSCLSQLKLAIESSCIGKKTEIMGPGSSKSFYSPQEVIRQARADYFVRFILEKYEKTNLTLAKKLGEANWQRWERLRKLPDLPLTEDELNKDSAIDFAGPEQTNSLKSILQSLASGSDFPESERTYSLKPHFSPLTLGLGTSQATPGSTFQTPIDTRSFASTSSLIYKEQLGFTYPPQETKAAKPSKCIACRQVIHSITHETQWREHLFEDLQPYVCCRDACHEDHTTFSSTREWIQHDNSHHGSQYDPPQACPLCKDFTSIDVSSYLFHVASHLESISFLALPCRTNGRNHYLHGAMTRSDRLPNLGYKQEFMRHQLQAAAMASSLHLKDPFEELNELNTATKVNNASVSSRDRAGDENRAGLIFENPADSAHRFAPLKTSSTHSTQQLGREEARTGFKGPKFPERDTSKSAVTRTQMDGSKRYLNLAKCRNCRQRRVKCVLREGCTVCDPCTARERICTWDPSQLWNYLSSTEQHIFHPAARPSSLSDISATFRKRALECAQLYLKLPEKCQNSTALTLDPGIWQCPRCEDSFADMFRWIDHISFTDPKELWWCPDHGNQFFANAKAALHHISISSIHPISTRLIARCNPSLLHFEVEKSIPKSRVCPVCDEVVSGWHEYYRYHLQTHFLAGESIARRREQGGASDHGLATAPHSQEIAPDSLDFQSQSMSSPRRSPHSPPPMSARDLSASSMFSKDNGEHQATSKQRDEDINLPLQRVDDKIQLDRHRHHDAHHALSLTCEEYLRQKIEGICPGSSHEQGPFFCLRPGCNATFKDEHAWIKHQEAWDPRILLWCPECPGEIHYHLYHFKDHVTLYHGDAVRIREEVVQLIKTRTCPICHLESDDWNFFHKVHVPACMMPEHKNRFGRDWNLSEGEPKAKSIPRSRS